MHSGGVDPCDFPKCGKLDRTICGSGGLRSRYPLIFKLKTDKLDMTGVGINGSGGWLGIVEFSVSVGC